MDEFEESKVQRQLPLRDFPFRAQPTPQQRPESFERVDMCLAEPIPVVIPGVLTLGMEAKDPGPQGLVMAREDVSRVVFNSPLTSVER
jgi:hypothetical protein